MRYLTIGLLLALTLAVVPVAAATDGPAPSDRDVGVFMETISDILLWLEGVWDAASDEIGAGIDPNGAPEAGQEPEPPSAPMGPGAEPNG